MKPLTPLRLALSLAGRNPLRALVRTRVVQPAHAHPFDHKYTAGLLPS